MSNYQKLINNEKLIRYLFKLTKNQFSCFVHIFKKQEKEFQGTCVKDLTETRNTTRSIAQRQLYHFYKEGLVERESITLAEFKKRCDKNEVIYEVPEGSKGYTYIYQPISYEKFITLIKQKLDEIKNGLS